MSSNINIFAGNMNASVERSRKLHKKVTKKFILFIFLLALGIAVLEAAFMFILYPKLFISRIQVSASSVPFTENELAELSGIRGGEYFFSVDTEAAENRIMETGLVSSVNVEKVFPSGINIDAAGRVPFAVTMIESEGGTVPVALDREGVVFPLQNGISDINMPIISGITMESYGMGAKIPAMYIPYLKNLEQIYGNDPRFLEQISEIRFLEKGESTFDVILYPTEGNIRIRTGNYIDNSMLRQAFLVIDVMEKNGLSSETEELELRNGRFTYKVKEG